VEKVADFDDTIMEKYIEGAEVSAEEIRAALRKGTIAMKIVPVLCGSSFKNKGTQMLLDAVADYLPSPIDLPEVSGVHPKDGSTIYRKASDSDPMCGLAFKLAFDDYGQLTFFRLYSGSIHSGETVYNPRTGKRERISKLVKMHSNSRTAIDEAFAGDIVAIVGLKDATTGDTLCSMEHPIILGSLDIPDPVIQVSVEPKTKLGQEKMALAFQRLSKEDPTFKTYVDKDTGQTIIAGMGELHLDIILDRLTREFKVEANVGQPQVAYKEAITQEVTNNYKYAKQTGGHGQYGHCVLRIEPNPEGGVEILDEIVGGVIPKQYIPAVVAGIKDALMTGPLGYEVVDCKIHIIDGSYHEVDSSEMAFKTAGAMCTKEAIEKASPILLEPMMKVEVSVPEEYMGAVNGSISNRRGSIRGNEFVNGIMNIEALCPLSEMFGYTSILRSLTQGRGGFTMQFEQYSPVPQSILSKFVDKFKKV
jgi:elongation factor G